MATVRLPFNRKKDFELNISLDVGACDSSGIYFCIYTNTKKAPVEGREQEPGCFHNGIILIVNYLNLVLQIYMILFIKPNFSALFSFELLFP